MDLSAIHWLDKELYPNPPEGTRHAIDLVARVSFVQTPDQTKTTPDASILLVHIEIESPDHTTALKPRFPYYYHFLRDTYQLPVLPIALYLKVGLDGIGIDSQVESLWTLEINRFQFLYVGLPELDGIQYVQSNNYLGVALSALMKIPRDKVAWLGAEALRRLCESPLPDQRKYLLGECVQAYLPLDDQQREEYEQLLQTETYEGVRAMNETVYEKGRRVERLEVVCSLLEERFGPVTEAIHNYLEQMTIEELRRLTSQILKASCLTELGLPESNS